MGFQTPMSCSVILESRPSAAEDVLKQILRALEEQGYTSDDVFAVHLAVEEAFVNAVKHGNKGDSEKTVKLEYSVDSEKVDIRMTDEGHGFNPEEVPDPRSDGNLFKPNGRGVLLIQAYMDEVRYNERGNEVFMVRYKNRPA